VDLAEARGVRPALRLGEQRGALRVGLQHGVQQAERAAGRFLRDEAEPGAGGQADLAAVGGDLTGDGAQQGGLARAVAPDQPDAPARVHGQVGAVQQRAPATAEGQVADRQHGHAGVLQQAPRRTAVVPGDTKVPLHADPSWITASQNC
jgi:hypothetical protein